MSLDPLAIVDVETTGTSSLYHRIIEIAVVRVERGEVVRRFVSLVNPERYVSPVIEQITGIRNQELEAAPTFRTIAREVADILDGAVFVAHNARFDYGFVRNEFERLGRRFTARCLCTVKLSRAVSPAHRRHDLSSVIERYGLVCEHRHRALGDADAVRQFLGRVRADLGEDRYLELLSKLLRTRTLPPAIDSNAVNDLPSSPGVYVFYGSAGIALYVGKSKSIRDRVLDHFSSRREVDMCQQVTRIESHPTSGDLGAMLLELQMIKQLRPVYNQVSRSTRPLAVVWREQTRRGYDRLTMTVGEPIPPAEAHRVMAVFKNRAQAVRFLEEASREHRLCHKFIGLENSRGACFQYRLGRCGGACVGEEEPAPHNARLEAVFDRRRVRGWPFKGPVIVTERGQGENEGEAFIVDQWCLLSSIRSTEMGSTPFLTGSEAFDYDSYKVLWKYLRDPRRRRNVREVSRRDLQAMMSEL